MKFYSQKFINPFRQISFTNRDNNNINIYQNFMERHNINKISHRTSKMQHSNIKKNTLNNHNFKPNRINYNKNLTNDFLKEEFNNINTSINQTQLVDYPDINLELEFQLLKDKINECNSKNSAKKYNFINQRYFFQKNMNKTENYMDISHSKKINQIQKIEKPVKNNINNYLFINNKFKYNNPNDNNAQERKHLRNINLNNFLNMKSEVRTKIKNKIDILDLDKEVSEDELSEIANKINIYNESMNKNKNSISKFSNIDNSLNKLKKENSQKNKNKKRTVLNKLIKKNFLPKPPKNNFSINNVNSLFIFN